MTTTLVMTPERIEALRLLLEQEGFRFRPLDHAHYQARGEGVTVNAYRSGKVVVQGKGEVDPRRIQPFAVEDLDGRAHFRAERSLQSFQGRPTVPEHWGGYDPIGFWLAPATMACTSLG